MYVMVVNTYHISHILMGSWTYTARLTLTIYVCMYVDSVLETCYDFIYLLCIYLTI